MSIRKRDSKKAKNGYVYEVFLTYKEDGVTKHYTKRGFSSKKEAEAHETIKKVELQEYGRIRKEITLTFEEVYNEFLELGCDQYQYNTIRNTNNIFNMYLQEDICKYKITQFDYAFLQKYFNTLAQTDNGIEKNKSIKKAINRILNFAVKMDYIKSNPIDLVTVKGVEVVSKKEKVIAITDFYKIIEELENMDSFKNQAYSVALQIGLYTGLRVSEALALEKSDFDFINNMIYIDKKLIYQGLTKKEFYVTHQLKSKTSNACIPLADKLKSVLIKWFDVNPYKKAVCDINGYYINPNTFGSDIKQITKKLNIEFHYHMLRHTFATMLVTNKVDIKVAQELMRHSNFNTTMTLYTHINDNMKKQTINDVFNSKCVENVLNPTNNTKLIS